LIVVVVPSTCRLPAITTVPVSSPCAAGSIVKVLGPLKYPVVVMLPEEIVPTDSKSQLLKVISPVEELRLSCPVSSVIPFRNRTAPSK